MKGSRCQTRDAIIIAAVTGLVILSRLPFLDAGYGADPDAWRVANAAQQIAATHQYTASRFPGYPLQEIVYSLMAHAGPFAFNLVTALVGAAGIAVFALILGRLGVRDRVAAALALGFTPVVYVNSTCSMDYVWALSLMLISLYLALTDKSVASGAVVGLAIGCRATSLLMLVPLSIVLLDERRSRTARLLTCWCATLVVAILLFLPVFLRYGWTFATFHDAPAPAAEIVYRATLAVWGAVGCAAIAAGFVLHVLLSRRRPPARTLSDRSLLIACGTAVVAWTALYLRLPHEAGYLIPVVPFVLLALSRLLVRPAFLLLCAALVVSPFVHLSPRGVTLDGQVAFDRATRLQRMERARSLLRWEARRTVPAVVVAGSYLPIVVNMRGTRSEKAVYVWDLNEEDARQYVRRGYAIYYEPDQGGSVRTFADIPVRPVPLDEEQVHRERVR